jgi:hypothetical protein
MVRSALAQVRPLWLRSALTEGVPAASSSRDLGGDVSAPCVVGATLGVEGHGGSLRGAARGEPEAGGLEGVSVHTQARDLCPGDRVPPVPGPRRTVANPARFPWPRCCTAAASRAVVVRVAVAGDRPARSTGCRRDTRSAC